MLPRILAAVKPYLNPRVWKQIGPPGARTADKCRRGSYRNRRSGSSRPEKSG